jgi:hypothetical protein
MLLSETHFTQNSYLRIPNYTLYHTTHPAGTDWGGTAIIIKNTIKRHPLPNYSRDYLQSTSVLVEDSVGHLIIKAVYLPHNIRSVKHNLKIFAIPSDAHPLLVAITMLNILTGDTGSSHLVIVKSLKLLKATTYPTSLRAILLTGLLTCIKSLIS